MLQKMLDISIFSLHFFTLNQYFLYPLAFTSHFLVYLLVLSCIISSLLYTYHQVSFELFILNFQIMCARKQTELLNYDKCERNTVFILNLLT